MNKYIAYFDGACGPQNPGGDIGIGGIIFDVSKSNLKFTKFGLRTPVMPDWTNVFSVSQFYKSYELGLTSNNVAEYMAFNECLIWSISNLSREDSILFMGDSNLVVKQITGAWRIKDGLYRDFAIEAKDNWDKLNVKTKFISWIPREFNTKADELSKAKGEFKY